MIHGVIDEVRIVTKFIVHIIARRFTINHHFKIPIFRDTYIRVHCGSNSFKFICTLAKTKFVTEVRFVVVNLPLKNPLLYRWITSNTALKWTIWLSDDNKDIDHWAPSL